MALYFSKEHRVTGPVLTKDLARLGTGEKKLTLKEKEAEEERRKAEKSRTLVERVRAMVSGLLGQRERK